MSLCRPSLLTSLCSQATSTSCELIIRRHRSHYETLGIDRSATLKEIKTAFYEKSKQIHPDNTASNSTSEFVELKAAYDILRRPADRRLYDYQLKHGHAAPKQDFRNPYAGFTHGPQYDYNRDWTKYWNEEPGRRQNMRDTDYSEREKKFWKSILKWSIAGTLLVIVYNSGYFILLRRKDYYLSKLKDDDEIAKSFMRQKDVDESNIEMQDLARLLKSDIDTAWRLRCEDFANRNPDEIREEYRWFKAVEDPAKNKKIKEARREKREIARNKWREE